MTRKTSLQFADFRLEPDQARLWHGAHVLRLKPKAFAVLCYLVEHAGQLVSKDELWQAVWPDVTVSDDVLTASVRDIRKALGDDPHVPQFIETVHRRGYRFIAPLTPSSPPVANSPVAVSAGEATPPPWLQSPTLPLPDKPSIIVLPFVNLSHDPEQEYFSDGLTDVLTGDLSLLSGLFVISRNSAFPYKGKAVKVQDVGREMGVRYVLEGSVQKAEQRVRVTTQLIEAATGGHLWAERYDRPLHDLFALQDEIVQKIVTTLKLQLTLEERGFIVRKHTDNLEAYDFFLRGRESFNRRTKEANVQARQLYERAIALDPQYAEAYTQLGWTYYVEWLWRWSADSQTLERAGELAQKALTLDDSLPIAHSLLGMVYGNKQQYDQATAEVERAIALDPNNADSYVWQAEVLHFAGRPEEALRALEQAMRLNPRCTPSCLFLLGHTYFVTGRYGEAVATLQEVIRRSPDFMYAHFTLATNYLLQWFCQQSPEAQTLEPAVAAVQRALALNDSLHWNHLLRNCCVWGQSETEGGSFTI